MFFLGKKLFSRPKSPLHAFGDFDINKQAGQTLIETVVAIFILTTGIATALGLAVYSFNATDNSSRQIVGTSLARVAVEAVKNMRDANWLSDTITSCTINGTSQPCYANWLTKKYNIPTDGNHYAIDYDDGTGGWKISGANPGDYRLNYVAATGEYVSHANYPSENVFSNYSRYITISLNTTAPFNDPNGAQLDIVSTVWWTGRGCASTSDPAALPASCKVNLEMHLTNWRSY